MLKKIKGNKYFLLSVILVLIMIVVSFIQFYREQFSYVDGYYKIKEYCYEEKDPDSEYCKIFKKKEHLEKYIITSDPKKSMKSMML